MSSWRDAIERHLRAPTPGVVLGCFETDSKTTPRPMQSESRRNPEAAAKAEVDLVVLVSLGVSQKPISDPYLPTFNTTKEGADRRGCGQKNADPETPPEKPKKPKQPLERGQAWCAAEWRAFFAERAGIAEHDGGLPRAAAEMRAFECALAEWQIQNPTRQLDPDVCLRCGGELGRIGPEALPVLDGTGGHVWLHAACWGRWTQARRQEAAAALAAMGVDAPAGWRP